MNLLLSVLTNRVSNNRAQEREREAHTTREEEKREVWRGVYFQLCVRVARRKQQNQPHGGSKYSL